MNYFEKRNLATVLAEHSLVNPIPSNLSLLPSYARGLLGTMLNAKIAEDFQILSLASMDSQNADLPMDSDGFSSTWFVFAYSGQGDFWLLKKEHDEIGFYDHNLENYSLASVEELHITLEEWIIAGDLFHQFDLLNETNPGAFNRNFTLKSPYKDDFIDKINSISKGLFERLPFNNI